jgi:photosystem II stability/assembly factor-like uncharacterized protein
MLSDRTIAVFTRIWAVLAVLSVAGAPALAAGPGLIEIEAEEAAAHISDLRSACGEGLVSLIGRGETAAFFYLWPDGAPALSARGVTYSVVLEDVEGLDLYLVPKASGVERPAVAEVSTVVLEDGSFYLVAAPAEGGEAVFGLPAKQRLASPSDPGLPLKTLLPAEAPAFAPQAYSALVQALADAVSQTNLYNQVAGLSGEFAVTIDGAPYTIRTRYSPTPGCKQAAAYLKEQFEALGLETEYDYFNFRKTITGLDFPVDNSEGWAVGGSIILHTVDQGASWWKQEDGSDATMVGVYMRDEQVGWVVGTEGTILMTEDGEMWSALASPTTSGLAAVFFPSQSTGYICGAAGTILKSIDGGHTWAKLTSGTTRDLSGIWFISDSEGWVVGDAGTIRKTTNGGSSWQTVSSPVTADLTEIAFAGPARGFITGLSGNLLRTLDGSNWQKLTIPVADALYSVAFADADHGWACGDGGSLLRTTDGGMTWNDLSPLVSFQFRDVWFVDAGEGWVAGNSTVQRSLDGGVTWTDQHRNVQAGDVNVVATLPGTTDPDEIYIACGHYDDTSQIPSDYAPGADDNATGTVGCLEAARALKDTRFEATMRFVCFSREEQGLVGSYNYARDCFERGDSIVGVLNFDMIGYADVMPEDLDAIYNGNSGWLADAYEAAAAQYVPGLPVITKYLPGLSASDHASFWGYGYPATCSIEDSNVPNPYYHRTTDRVSTLNFTFYTNVVRATVATLADLARVDSVTAGVPAGEPVRIISVGPNPGRGEIALRMTARSGTAPDVRVYDVEGRLVQTLVPAVDGGLAEAVWRGDDSSGSQVSPGIYFFRPQGSERAVKVELVK